MIRTVLWPLSVGLLACRAALPVEAQVVQHVEDAQLPAFQHTSPDWPMAPNPAEREARLRSQLAEPPVAEPPVAEPPVAEPPVSVLEAAVPGYTAAPTLADQLHGAFLPAVDPGVGSEWLANAPFEIDSAQPLSHTRFRIDAGYGQRFPDRLEYFWAKSPGGRGPSGAGVGENSVDFQDFRFQFEVGGDKFSVATEIPIRVIDPVLNHNTAGLGDMSVTTKTVLCNGRTWQLTQVFKSYFNTGSPKHGTGTGHPALEPGLLVRHRWNDYTHLHGEVKYWFALGGDTDHSGQFLRYGFGISHLLYDSDSFAIIPTLEFVAWTALDGQQTLPNSLLVSEIDSVGILNLYPGLRFVFDPPGDWPMWDLGIAGGLPLTNPNNRWYDGILRVDMRWKF